MQNAQNLGTFNASEVKTSRSVDFAAGTSITFLVIDAHGDIQYTEPCLVGPSQMTFCLKPDSLPAISYPLLRNRKHKKLSTGAEVGIIVGVLGVFLLSGLCCLLPRLKCHRTTHTSCRATTTRPTSWPPSRLVVNTPVLQELPLAHIDTTPSKYSHRGSTIYDPASR